MLRVTATDLNKVDVFHRAWLRRVLRRFWPNHLSNEDLYKATGSTPVSAFARVRRWRWIGNILRTSPSNISRTALTENDFKTRYRNHTAPFRHAKHKNSTELSKHIWTLKENNIDHSISWRILSSSSSYNSSNKRCNLCLKEKFLIICRPDLSSLNKRNELVSSCRHRNKALLRNN